MIQYYSGKHKHTSKESASRKVTVEAIMKQLEYITKGHIAMQTILL